MNRTPVHSLLVACSALSVAFTALAQEAPPSATPPAAPRTPAAEPPRRPAADPAQAQPTTNRPEPGRPSTVTRPLSVAALESRDDEPAPLRGAGGGSRGSLTAVGDPEPRSFKVHDLITIVVSEQSKAKSSANSKTDKKYDMSVQLDSFMNLDPSEWADIISLGAADLPQFDVGGKKKFDAKGDVARQDDFTAKITGEVIEVLPNGTIVVEAYKQINMDGETQTIRLSGRCRPEDVDATNSVQSHRLANAAIEKLTKGQLRDSTEKGIIARVVDMLFAF
jgi:flagellar L-ring protein precursor FlgH